MNPRRTSTSTRDRVTSFRSSRRDGRPAIPARDDSRHRASAPPADGGEPTAAGARATATIGRLIGRAPWTSAVAAAILALNLGLVPGAPAFTRDLLQWLEFERAAAASGEVWRLVSGSLVHWSLPHLALCLGAFIVVGFVFERRLGRAYPALLLGAAVAVGLGILFLEPGVSLYRGLSGVASGQFAAAALGELVARGRSRLERLVALPALLIVGVKLVYECATGRMMFGTEGLGDLGLPSPLSHAAGTLGALVVLLARTSRRVSTAAP